MNITLLCNRDLASCVALNLLLPRLLPAHRLQIILSSRVGKSPLAPELKSLRFAEQDLFNELLFPLLDRLPGDARGELLSFNALAAVTGQDLLLLNRINQEPELEQFRAGEPDLVISIRYGVILKAPVLPVPRLGVINLHSGLLPAYRGVMASFWALLANEAELGSTLHWIDDDSIDTGRIIGCSRLPVQRQKSYLEHVLALYPGGCELIVDAVHTLASGAELPAQAQPEAGAYFGFPDSAALQAFSSAGWQLLDQAHLLDLARRFQPYS